MQTQINSLLPSNEKVLVASQSSLTSHSRPKSSVYNYSSPKLDVSPCLTYNYFSPFDLVEKTSLFLGHQAPISTFHEQKDKVEKDRTVLDSTLFEPRENTRKTPYYDGIKNGNINADISENGSNYKTCSDTRQATMNKENGKSKNNGTFVTNSDENWYFLDNTGTPSIRNLLSRFPCAESFVSNDEKRKFNYSSNLNIGIKKSVTGTPIFSESSKLINVNIPYINHLPSGLLADDVCWSGPKSFQSNSPDALQNLEDLTDAYKCETNTSNCESFFASGKHNKEICIARLFDQSTATQNFRKRQGATIISIGLFLSLFGLIFTALGVCGLNLANGLFAPIPDVHQVLQKHFYKGGENIVFAVILWGVFFNVISFSLFYWACKVCNRSSHKKTSIHDGPKTGGAAANEPNAEESNSDSGEYEREAVILNDNQINHQSLLQAENIDAPSECASAVANENVNVCAAKGSDTRIVERQANNTNINGLKQPLASRLTSIPLVRIIV